MSAFTQTFLADFFQSIHRVEQNNWDHLRFQGDHPRASNFMIDNAVHWMYAIMRNIDQYEAAFELLEDDYSRALMIKLLEYDILDHHHVKLPLNTPEFWASYNSVDEKYLVKQDAVPFGDGFVNLYRIPDMDMQIYGHALTVLTHFILKQYFFQRGPVIQPAPGDVCIDAGACRGEVSLHFAHAVGAEGKVYGFEFVPANIEIFKQNLAMNPAYSSLVHLVPYPLWHESGQEMRFSDRGAASSIRDGQAATGELQTTTLTIDDFVRGEGIDRVDFIKMDIEGAEVNALAGGQATIKKHLPKLAICAYHKKDDFYRIPSLIRQIDAGYKFYLDHYTIHREETVLYAVHPDRSRG